MPDFARTPAEPAIDPILDDQRAADSAADRQVEQRGMTAPRTKPGLGQPGGIGIVLDDDRRDLQTVANPVRERKILPAANLIGPLDASLQRIHRPSDADAGRLDLWASESG